MQASSYKKAAPSGFVILTASDRHVWDLFGRFVHVWDLCGRLVHVWDLCGRFVHVKRWGVITETLKAWVCDPSM